MSPIGDVRPDRHTSYRHGEKTGGWLALALPALVPLALMSLPSRP